MADNRAELEAKRVTLMREKNRLQDEMDRIARTEMDDITPTSRTPAELRYIELNRQQDAVIDQLIQVDRVLDSR